MESKTIYHVGDCCVQSARWYGADRVECRTLASVVIHPVGPRGIRRLFQVGRREAEIPHTQRREDAFACKILPGFAENRSQRSCRRRGNPGCDTGRSAECRGLAQAAACREQIKLAGLGDTSCGRSFLLCPREERCLRRAFPGGTVRTISRSRPAARARAARRGCQGWPRRLRGHRVAARSVLDSPEHGASLTA